MLANSGSAVPRLVRRIPVKQALGLPLTHDGRYLLAASLTGAVVIGVRQAEQGAQHAVLGTLRSLRALASGFGTSGFVG